MTSKSLPNKQYAKEPVLAAGQKREDADNVQINYNDAYTLIGRMLTYVDATYSDKEQREAQKSIVKREIKGWMVGLYKEQYPDKPEYHI